jgi:hypothetical protein
VPARTLAGARPQASTVGGDVWGDSLIDAAPAGGPGVR